MKNKGPRSAATFIWMGVRKLILSPHPTASRGLLETNQSWPPILGYIYFMDPQLIRTHLAEAERHIALSNRHIARQIEIINELKRGGHPTNLALDLLATYRAAHASHLAHCDLIRETRGVKTPASLRSVRWS